MARVKEENAQLRYQKEVSVRDYQSVMAENNSLNFKLENLESIFVGASIKKDGGKAELKEYAAAKVDFIHNCVSWRLKILI